MDLWIEFIFTSQSKSLPTLGLGLPGTLIKKLVKSVADLVPTPPPLGPFEREIPAHAVENS